MAATRRRQLNVELDPDVHLALQLMSSTRNQSLPDLVRGIISERVDAELAQRPHLAAMHEAGLQEVTALRAEDAAEQKKVSPLKRASKTGAAHGAEPEKNAGPPGPDSRPDDQHPRPDAT